MEHARNLNNEWYCHKLFWILNPLFVIILNITAPILDRFPGDYFDYVFMAIETVISLTAVVCLYMTRPKKRIMIPIRRQSLTENLTGTNLLKTFKENPIRVALKFGLANDEFIRFETETELVKGEVKRKFDEFIAIEKELIEYVQRNVPSMTHQVPILEKRDMEESSSITAALEKRLKNIQFFLNTI